MGRVPHSSRSYAGCPIHRVFVSCDRDPRRACSLGRGWVGRRPARTALPHPLPNTVILSASFEREGPRRSTTRLNPPPLSPKTPALFFAHATTGRARVSGSPASFARWGDFTRAEDRSFFEPFASLTAYRSRTRKSSRKNPSKSACQPPRTPKIPRTHIPATTSP
jgi:hypothetical protein